MSENVIYRDLAFNVRQVRDEVAAELEQKAQELKGLNEENALEALEYAEELLANALQRVRLCIMLAGLQVMSDGCDKG